MPPVIHDAPLQQLIMRTSKNLWPKLFPSDGWADPPAGVVFPHIADQTDEGDTYKWTIELNWGGGATQDAKNNFIDYCQGWNNVFSPYTSNQPDGVYFFFGLYLMLDMPCSQLSTGKYMFIGRGKSGKDNPWWAGGPDFSVPGNHKSATFTIPGGPYCTNAQNIEVKSGGNVGELDFRVNKYITS